MSFRSDTIAPTETARQFQDSRGPAALRTGTIVRHAEHGLGEVEYIIGDGYLVHFFGRGSKTVAPESIRVIR